jgi:hypothetical protein
MDVHFTEKPEQNFGVLEASSKIDNVLLEYYLAVELMAVGYLEKVIPVFIGEVTEGDLASGTVEFGEVLGPAFLPDFPEVCVTSVSREVRRVLDDQAIICTDENRTVKDIMMTITAKQGIKIEGSGAAALSTAVRDILSTCRKEEVVDEAIDGYDYLTNECRTLRFELRNVKQENELLKTSLSSKESEISRLKDELESLKSTASSKSEQPSKETTAGRRRSNTDSIRMDSIETSTDDCFSSGGSVSSAAGRHRSSTNAPPPVRMTGINSNPPLFIDTDPDVSRTRQRQQGI